eukprot:jgi/Bigna1/74249/fgenesh1_pg.28_\
MCTTSAVVLFDCRSLLLLAFAASADSQDINPWREQGRFHLRRSLLSKYGYGRDLPSAGSSYPLQGGGEEGAEAMPPRGDEQQAETPEDLNAVSQQEGGLQGGGEGGKKAAPVTKNFCATAVGEAKAFFRVYHGLLENTWQNFVDIFSREKHYCFPFELEVIALFLPQNLQGTLKLALKSSESQSDFCNKAIAANAWAVPYAMAVAPFDNIKKESAAVGDPFKATKTLYQRYRWSPRILEGSLADGSSGCRSL